MDHSVAPHVPTGLVRTDQRRVLVLGSTGSVGTQALDVIAANSGAFAVARLAAGGADPATVAAQAVRFRVPLIALGRPSLYAAETPDGTPNFKLSTGSNGGAAPKLGDLKISDGNSKRPPPCKFNTSNRSGHDRRPRIRLTASGGPLRERQPPRESNASRSRGLFHART